MKFPYHPLTGTTGNEKELRQLLLLKAPGHDCSLNPGCLFAGGAEHSPSSVVQSAGISTESLRELAGIPEVPPKSPPTFTEKWDALRRRLSRALGLAARTLEPSV